MGEHFVYLEGEYIKKNPDYLVFMPLFHQMALIVDLRPNQHEDRMIRYVDHEALRLNGLPQAVKEKLRRYQHGNAELPDDEVMNLGLAAKKGAKAILQDQDPGLAEPNSGLAFVIIARIHRFLKDDLYRAIDRHIRATHGAKLAKQVRRAFRPYREREWPLHIQELITGTGPDVLTLYPNRDTPTNFPEHQNRDLF